MQVRCPSAGTGAQRCHRKRLPWRLLALSAAHAAYIGVYSARAWHRAVLPRRLDGHHAVYNDLERAAARILLPLKRDAFPVLASDAVLAAEVEEGGRLPGCAGVGRTGRPPEDGSILAGGPLSELPLWALPDDNAGLQGLVEDQVRAVVLQPLWRALLC